MAPCLFERKIFYYLDMFRFADDIALITLSRHDIVEVARELDEAGRTFGMEINAEKSKLMAVGNKRIRININNEVEGTRLEKVNHFKYIRWAMTENGQSMKGLRVRIAIA